MLILSRREAEKVLFPKLGITIEVTRIQGRTVRLGIDAPDEIRIIRSELADTADWDVKPNPNKPKSYSADPNDSWTPPLDVAKCLNAANLAIHLAQNQLQQQLNENAEEALEHAIECLRNLEVAVGIQPDQPTPVREARASYGRQVKKIAVCVDFDAETSDEMEEKLQGLGYQSLKLNDSKSLIEFLRHRDQPNLVFTIQRPALASENEFDHLDSLDTLPICDSHAGLRMFGIGSLQKCARKFSLGDAEVTGWFSDSADANALTSCFH